MLPIDSSYLDKSLPIPVGTQLRGLMVNLLSHGGLPPGSRLPSVRDLASDLGIAVMTVTNVYQQLASADLIEIRRGLGAFTVRDPQKLLKSAGPIVELRADIDALLRKASGLGVSPMDLVTIISAQAQLKTGAGLEIVFVGPFAHTTQHYVSDIGARFQLEDTVTVVTFDQIRSDEALRARATGSDLVLTVANREPELRGLLPGANVFAVRLVISENTKSQLSGLPASARIGAVASVKEYIATLRPGIRELAPQVSDIKVTWAKAPGVKAYLADRDVIVHSSGADPDALSVPGAKVFEFRHSPDPREIEEVLVPLLISLRRNKLA